MEGVPCSGFGKWVELSRGECITNGATPPSFSLKDIKEWWTQIQVIATFLQDLTYGVIKIEARKAGLHNLVFVRYCIFQPINCP